MAYWATRSTRLQAASHPVAAPPPPRLQVRSALLSGADRERCYLLRATAYLHVGNVDNAKRDLGAILQKEPDHEEARKLRRGMAKV